MDPLFPACLSLGPSTFIRSRQHSSPDPPIERTKYGTPPPIPTRPLSFHLTHLLPLSHHLGEGGLLLPPCQAGALVLLLVPRDLVSPREERGARRTTPALGRLCNGRGRRRDDPVAASGTCGREQVFEHFPSTAVFAAVSRKQAVPFSMVPKSRKRFGDEQEEGSLQHRWNRKPKRVLHSTQPFPITKPSLHV